MGDGRHDRDLGAGREDPGAKAIQDLGHHEDADVGVWLAEGNQKGSAEENEGDSCERNVFEVARVADQEANNRREDGGGQRVGVEYVASRCDT